MRRFDPATRERGRPARIHPRYVPLSFPAMRHPASQRATLEQQERWDMGPPGSAGVPPACTPVTCRSVSLRCGTRRASAPPSSSKSDGTWAHLGARASRPHAPPLRAAQFPCDTAPGKPARDPRAARAMGDGLGARASRPHAPPLRAPQFPAMRHPATLPRERQGPGRSRVLGPLPIDPRGADSQRCFRPCAGGLHSMTSSQPRRSIRLCVYSWSVFNNHRQFLPPMTCPTGQVRNLFETAIP